MPDIFGPFDTATWGQGPWYRDAWARSESGVYAPAGTGFGTSTTGDLALTVSGLGITMALGRAHVRGAGYERTGTAWSYTVPANTSTNPRIDRLVLRRDLAAKTITPLVLQGTPAATPAAPALTQVEDGVWDLPLFRFTVPANSGAPLTGVVDERFSPGRWVQSGVPITTGMTASTGWSISAQYMISTPPGWCYAVVSVQRTGASIAINTAGDITATPIATLNDATYYPQLAVPCHNYGSGRVAVGNLNTLGVWQLEAVGGTAAIATGEFIELHAGFYPIAAQFLT